MRRKSVRVAADVRFYGLPIVGLAPNSSISVGARSVLTSQSRSTALGVSRPVILRTLKPGAAIVIGPDSGLSGTVICAAESVKVGSGCLIGADVLIADTDFHPVDSIDRRYAPLPLSSPNDAITIGNNVFIGARVIVLKGVRIGDNAVVGAGAVVVADVPDNAVVAGNPARLLRMLASREAKGGISE